MTTAGELFLEKEPYVTRYREAEPLTDAGLMRSHRLESPFGFDRIRARGRTVRRERFARQRHSST